MATIRQRNSSDGSTTWQAIIRKTGFPPQSAVFRTRAEAVDWATTQEAAMVAGNFVDRRAAKEVTVGELLERYMAEITPKKRGFDREVVRIKRMLRTPLARYSAHNCTSDVMAKWRDDRLKSVTGSTVNRDLNLIGHMFEVARKEWRIPFPVNPVQDIRRPPENPPRDRRLLGDEEARLLAACQSGLSDYLYAAVILSIETSMRRAEVVALDWRHIDLDRKVARLQMTKNGDKRDVPLSTRAVAALESVKTSRDGQVFKGWTPNAYRLAYVRAVKRAGISGLTLHDLRHEAASRLFEKGLDMMEVASITGHKSLSMLKRYTHLKAEDLARKLG